MTAFRVAFRFSAFRFAAPALVLVGAFVGLSAMYPTVTTSDNVASAALAVSHMLAPFIAGIAAWDGLAPVRYRMLDLDLSSPRPLPSLELARFGACLVWAVATAVTCFITLTVRALFLGLREVPDLGIMALAVAGLIFFAGVGFLLAALTRWWGAIPVAAFIALGLYAVDLFASGPGWLRALNPIGRFTSTDWYSPDTWQFVAHAGCAIAFAGALLAALALRNRQTRFLGGLILVAAAGVLALSLGSVIGAGGRTWVPQPDDEDLVALEGDHVTLHVRPHYTAVADDLLRTWDRMAMLFGDSSLSFEVLVQQTDSDHEGAEGSFQRLYVNPLASDIATDSIESSLIDVMGCLTGTVEPGGSLGLGGELAVHTWLMGSPAEGIRIGDPRADRAAQWLGSLTDEAATSWVAEHADNILTCTWDPEDFGA